MHSRAINLQDQNAYDYLIDDETLSTHSRRRETKVNGEAHAEKLLRLFGDPYDAVAAAILVVACQDLKWNRNPRDVLQFMSSAWFETIVTELGFDADRFWKMARQVQAKSVAARQTKEVKTCPN